MSPITLSENSVEKMQVFCPWSSLRMSACTVPRTFSCAQARIFAVSCSFGCRPCCTTNLSICWSIAVLMNIARMVGAGPLMVIDTGIADFAVDIRALVRIESIERHRVERGRQALGRHVPGQEFEARVGAERIAFAREHAGR